jgi:hypothetical protein
MNLRKVVQDTETGYSLDEGGAVGVTCASGFGSVSFSDTPASGDGAEDRTNFRCVRLSKTAACAIGYAKAGSSSLWDIS